MNVKELERILKELNVPEDLYSLCLGGLPNEKLCLASLPDGQWEVYYSERGCKNGLKKFETEAAACEYMLKKLKIEVIHKNGRS